MMHNVAQDAFMKHTQKWITCADGVSRRVDQLTAEQRQAQYDASDNSSYEDRCCGNAAYEQSCEDHYNELSGGY